MKTQFHESADLLDMLLFTVKVIATSESGDKQRIANAYQASRHESGESVRLLRTYPELRLV